MSSDVLMLLASSAVEGELRGAGDGVETLEGKRVKVMDGSGSGRGEVRAERMEKGKDGEHVARCSTFLVCWRERNANTLLTSEEWKDQC